MDVDVLTGAGGTLALGGRLLTMSQMTVGDIGRLSAWVKERRRSPYERAVEALRILAPMREFDPQGYEKERNDILLAARADANSGASDASEINDLASSMSGLAYTIWLSVRKSHPDVTVEWITAALDQEDLLVIQEKIDAINKAWQEYLPKNSPAAPDPV